MIPEFGTQVLVNATTVRVVGRPYDTGTRWVPSRSGHVAGRYADPDFDEAAGWPGAAIPLEDEPYEGPPGTFALDPRVNGSPVVRLRRIPLEIPTVGIVVGSVHKREGTVHQTKARGGLRGQLGGPGRGIWLTEVALRPSRSAQLVLVWAPDMEELRR